MTDPTVMDVDTPVEQVEEGGYRSRDETLVNNTNAVIEKPKKPAKKRLEVKKVSVATPTQVGRAMTGRYRDNQSDTRRPCFVVIPGPIRWSI